MTNRLPRDFLPMAQITRVAEVQIPRAPMVLDYSHKFATFGSCFAENIKRLLETFGFDLYFRKEVSFHYSTESLANILRIAADRTEANEENILVEEDGSVTMFRTVVRWRIHGADAKANAISQIALLVANMREALIEADSVVITLGTSSILRLKENGQVLACATGVSKAKWDFEVLDEVQNFRFLSEICDSILRIRGGRPANVIFTISPQRYLFGRLESEDHESYEGMAIVQNMLSKANLLVATQKLVGRGVPGLNLVYFPAFEIVYEELRQFESIAHYDYIHINQHHTPELVIKKFINAYCSQTVIDQMIAYTKARAIFDVSIHQYLVGGLPKSDPRVVALVDEVERLLDGFEPDLCAPMIHIRYRLFEEHGRALRRNLDAYRFAQNGNKITAAELLLREGKTSEARALLGAVADNLKHRWTMDPRNPKSFEQMLYERAIALRDGIGGA